VRVVAGRLGGRTLSAPVGDATRPTGARVKEALFSILNDVQGARVLDLYAGSGALGIEALSRGAASVVFVEAERSALTCLRENLSRLGLQEQAEVLAQRVEAARAKLVARGPFDLVLCDPPWRDVQRARAELEALAGAGALAPSARVALEHSVKSPPSAPNADTGQNSALCAVDQRHWGDTGVTFFNLKARPADVPVPSEA
jgi:16S rRNA (guanine966-N2)-methyltransferase